MDRQMCLVSFVIQAPPGTIRFVLVRCRNTLQHLFGILGYIMQNLAEYALCIAPILNGLDWDFVNRQHLAIAEYIRVVRPQLAPDARDYV